MRLPLPPPPLTAKAAEHPPAQASAAPVRGCEGVPRLQHEGLEGLLHAGGRLSRGLDVSHRVRRREGRRFLRRHRPPCARPACLAVLPGVSLVSYEQPGDA
eukprot:scaffold66515_cov66-Phaeocystis_antarctica.AAC.6